MTPTSEASPEQPFRILSLDGGGIMGAIPASALAAFEQATGRRIVEHFDLITGTSTGGIIAIALVPLPANRDLKSYAAAAKGLESSLWHLAITFATDFVVQLNGCAVSFHSLMKAISRSASFSLLGKSTILSRFLLRMLNHCSTWFIHEQWTGG